jgi:hypothetical protein
VLYASNEAIDYMKRQPQPGRVIALPLSDALGAAESFVRGGGQGNGLMSHHVRTVLGYHGNQLGRYDRLLGLDDGGRQLVNPNFWALTNTRFWLTNVDSLPIPGTKRVVGPVRDVAGTALYLFELPGENPVAWLVPAMMKARDEEVLSTILDPRFDVRRIALFDTAAAVAGQAVNRLPEPLSIRVSATSYEPGRISLALDAPAPAGSALVVAENYYPGWSATVDGRPARLGRADYALIGIELPTGGRNVVLAFDSAPYHTGKTVTLVALAVAAVWWLLRAFTERKRRV